MLIARFVEASGRSRLAYRPAAEWLLLSEGVSLDTWLSLGTAAGRALIEGASQPLGALLPSPAKPIESQEVWAAGLTYERSRKARVEETVTPDPYDRAFLAERPELFFKATAERVRGPGEAIAIRADSTWDVPEPELALVCNAALEVVGYTIGNDVSSRSIEGENPLYLPQAKIYAGSCALGPVIAPAWAFVPGDNAIELRVTRAGKTAFSGATSTRAMRRRIPDLLTYLGRHNHFQRGVILLTGTGIVPPDDFSLQLGDEVTIRIEGIGELRNAVERAP
jgi:2-dehydro-3-deoxy-D-arabinonate dehydratase